LDIVSIISSPYLRLIWFDLQVIFILRKSSVPACDSMMRRRLLGQLPLCDTIGKHGCITVYYNEFAQ